MKNILLALCMALVPLAASATIDFEGRYECSGSSSYSTENWSQHVTVDASDPNKLWFDSFYPFGNMQQQPIYGILSDDQTTINIPVGQVLIPEDDGLVTLLEGGTPETAYNCDVTEGGNIVGKIVETNGKIVITLESWYSARCYQGTTRTNYWYGAVRPGATFTKDPAIQQVTTEDGIQWTIYVLDEEAKTCAIGIPKKNAIDYSTTGFVDIPENLNGYTVVSISRCAFCYCENVTGFNIPKTVTEISDYAFAYTPSVETITVDGANSVYSSPNGCNAIIETATNTLLAGCKNTVIPAGIQTIGIHAFDGCLMTSIDIPASVETIDGSFGSCTELKSVNFAAGSNLKTIGDGSFRYCTSLTSFTIPDKVEYIGVQAFMQTGLTSIVIPASVTKIDLDDNVAMRLFAYCENLTSIVVAEGNKVYDSRDNCNAVIETATNTLLLGCSGSHIPQGVTTIGYSAFSTFRLPDGFTIPSGITTIRDHAFSDTHNLVNLELPEGLETLGHFSFASSSDLKTIILPSTLKELGQYIFRDCDKLEIVTSHIQQPTAINENCFSVYEDAVLFVPKGTKDVYKATEGWNKFANILEEGETLPWVHLGKATFTDNYLFETTTTCDVYQSSSQPNKFRLTNPFGTIVQQYGYPIDAEYSDYLTITVLQPGEQLNGVEITQRDLVYFPELKTGFRYTFYDAVVCLLHPSEFESMNTEDKWTFNRVLSYQDSGLPSQIQLAPEYYMYDVGGWNQTQTDNIILINFPTAESVGVAPTKATSDTKVIGCYSVNGQVLNTPQRGLNIVKLSDGRTVKVFKK